MTTARRWAVVVVAAVALQAWAAEPVVLKMGSLAPRESPWGLVLRAWAKAVKEKTGGEVTLEFYWNGTQGDELAQVSKMKTGQLDGAVVSAVGLGGVVNDVNALQLPGVFPDWATLDKVRDALTPEFDKAFRAAGFELIGWGDVGLDRFQSKGYPVRLPSDLKGKRPWIWRDDPILPPVFAIIGVTPVPTSAAEALPELSTGNVNAMSISALGSEQLQWSARLDHLSLLVIAPNIGGVLMSKAKLDALAPAQRAVVLETGRITCKALTERIRKEDDAALERARKRMTIIEPTAEEKAAWAKVFAQARERLAKGTFGPALVKRIEDLAK